MRPTGDRVREALFNMLAHAGWADDPLTDAIALDAFCGTGALGLEALSRGAAHLTLMDIDPRSLALARQNVATLKEEGRVALLRADAARPPPAKQPATLAFLDPPYGKSLAEKALPALAEAGWLAPECVCVVETAREDDFTPPPGFALRDERCYGETRITFLQRTGQGIDDHGG